ncbi:MAG: hypothetical protein ACYS7M_14215 [Planctomycetota bacterium]|jgi:hypothetical protein
MVRRFAGACLGLLAFIFCVLGLGLGAIAQVVVKEHVRRREQEAFEAQTTVTQDANGTEEAPNGATDNDHEPPVAEVVRPDATVG